jgi:hypothetical protein
MLDWIGSHEEGTGGRPGTRLFLVPHGLCPFGELRAGFAHRTRKDGAASGFLGMGSQLQTQL